MISFDAGTHKFNLRAAAVCRRDDEVLLHRIDGDSIWALPGGRVEPGENAARTVVRELEEETGETVECQDLLYVVENFFSERGQSNHEIGLYFRVKLNGLGKLQTTRAPFFGIEGNSALEFRWFTLATISDVNLHPRVLRSLLGEPPAGIRHVVQRE